MLGFGAFLLSYPIDLIGHSGRPLLPRSGRYFSAVTIT